MRFKYVILGVVFLTVVLAFLFWPKDTTTNRSDLAIELYGDKVVEPVDTRENVKTRDWVAPTITYNTYDSQYGRLPPSLEGTHIPFNLQINGRGQLIVNESLRRLFDYFFTTAGEEASEKILLRIEELLTAHLPKSAQARAVEILHQYFNLKQAEIELAKQLDMTFRDTGERPGLGEMRRLQRDLRATNLDLEVYEAFYGIESQRDDYALNKLEISRDKSLSDVERRAAMEAIEQNLPEEDREHLKVERTIGLMYKDVASAREVGASEAEIFHIREQALGTEAAQRYSDADRKKSEWDSRISTYRDERSGILNTEGLSEEDKNYQIELLQQQHFEGNELKRIPVIDRMKDSQ